MHQNFEKSDLIADLARDLIASALLTKDKLECSLFEGLL